MRRLDLTLSTPAENLAVDEWLLDECERGADLDGTLRFHEPDRTCVVVGYGNRVEAEVNLPACEAAGIPVLRRLSGGGAVVLGPGCLAYCLALPLDRSSGLDSITGTNHLVMERNRAALESLLGRPVLVRGHTDLVVDGRKFSGNSQRRLRRAVLFHGTFLLKADLAAIAGLLRHPTREPDYREGRPHREFVTNLGIGPEVVRASLAKAWGAQTDAAPPSLEAVENLVRERYGRPEWNRRS